MMFKIAGFLQEYPWGIPGGLTSWIPADRGLDRREPEAELWFGAHRNGPSPLGDGAGGSLRDHVGSEDVPLLVKLLAASRPLSIQVHPQGPLAERVFAAQGQDPALPRLLSDSAAKTEMLIALKPFSALQGFRDPGLAAAILEAVGGPTDDAVAALRSGDIRHAIRTLLALSPGQVQSAIDRLPAAAAGAGLQSSGVRALAFVADSYPGDPGVLVAALLDHVELDPGQAVFLPTGVAHSYVSGTGAEVMTASDNVLRLGLTNKPIAVDLGIEAIDPDGRPQLLSPRRMAIGGDGNVRRYDPDGGPFCVSWMEGGDLTFSDPCYRLVLNTGGQATVAGRSGELNLSVGEAAAVLADEGAIHVKATADVFVSEARAPLPGAGPHRL